MSALGMVLAFAQDEPGPSAPAPLTRIQPDERRERVETGQSCVDDSRNGSRIRMCTSTARVQPLELVMFAVTNELAARCGPAVVDFGDKTRSRPLAPGRSTLEHAFDRTGTFAVRVVSAACPPSDGLRVTVRP